MSFFLFAALLASGPIDNRGQLRQAAIRGPYSAWLDYSQLTWRLPPGSSLTVDSSDGICFRRTAEGLLSVSVGATRRSFPVQFSFKSDAWVRAVFGTNPDHRRQLKKLKTTASLDSKINLDEIVPCYKYGYSMICSVEKVPDSCMPKVKRCIDRINLLPPMICSGPRWISPWLDHRHTLYLSCKCPPGATISAPGFCSGQLMAKEPAQWSAAIIPGVLTFGLAGGSKSVDFTIGLVDGLAKPRFYSTSRNQIKKVLMLKGRVVGYVMVASAPRTLRTAIEGAIRRIQVVKVR